MLADHILFPTEMLFRYSSGRWHSIRFKKGLHLNIIKHILKVRRICQMFGKMGHPRGRGSGIFIGLSGVLKIESNALVIQLMMHAAQLIMMKTIIFIQNNFKVIFLSIF